ncbi:hypothetical protein GYB59_23585 [bacterium]|nr:hypothetical protein [bacterium]
MVEMLHGLEFWTADAIASEFDFGVKRKKTSELSLKLREIQSKAKNPSRLVILFGGTPTDESERDLFDFAIYDWEDNWSRRSDYRLENDDKAAHWWRLLTDDEQRFLNEEYKRVCVSYYESLPDDREDPLAIEFRYGYNPAWEKFKKEVSNRPSVVWFEVIEHGLVELDSTCDCDRNVADGVECVVGEGDTPDEAIINILDQFRYTESEGSSYIDYFVFSVRLRDYFGNRALPICGHQYWSWMLEDEPSGVAKTMKEAGIEREPVEPTRDQFASDAEFESAFQEFEEQYEAWNQAEDWPTYVYRFCLLFRIAEQLETTAADGM